ncbi:hypothetical protein [[Mycobacterium] appelbergii]|nr:hypothetical protein [Mycobacterium sp. 21AC1]
MSIAVFISVVTSLSVGRFGPAPVAAPAGGRTGGSPAVILERS